MAVPDKPQTAVDDSYGSEAVPLEMNELVQRAQKGDLSKVKGLFQQALNDQPQQYQPFTPIGKITTKSQLSYTL